MNTIPSNLFTWDRKARAASTEISTLEANGYKVGKDLINIISDKTGSIKTFAFNSTMAQGDGMYEPPEITGWKYVGYINNLDWVIIIFND